MNIAETSYRVGKALKKIDAGKELLEVIKVTKEKTSPDAWHNFSRLVISNAREGFGHYFGIPNAYYLLEANKDNQKVDVLKREIEEILSISEYKRLVELGIYFGKALEELQKEVIAPTTPKSFAGTVAKPKLKRKIQDLHVSVQRTDIIKYIFTNFANKPHLMKIFSEYDSKRKKYPFVKENRILIQELSSSDEEVKVLFLNELFSSVFDFMKRLIFESHLDLIIELNETDITSQTIKSISKFSIIRIDTPNPLLLNEGFTFKLAGKEGEKFGYFNDKQFSYSQEDFNCKMGGYVYPQNDKGLFML